MVEVTAWSFPSLTDEVALVLIRLIANRCWFVQRCKCILGHADRRSLALTAGQSHSSVSAAGAPQDGPQLGGTQGAQPNLGYLSHLTTQDLGC